MKKVLLLLPFIGMLTAGAQNSQHAYSFRDNKPQRLRLIESNTPSPSSNNLQVPTLGASHSGERATVLNSIQIGSAGNLLTVLNSNTNPLHYDPTLNTVTFVHRADDVAFPGSSVARYRFDKSTDGGASWISDIGDLTPSPDNVSINGRFPQGVIFNPAGNTIPDSAYLIYCGTWHDGSNGSWEGELRGAGKISGDLSTFSEHVDIVNNGNVQVGSGFCKGAGNTFWNVNQWSDAGFSSTDFITNGVVVEKGVWNATTKDVDWTSFNIPIDFIESQGTGGLQSVATAFNIAFDPTGTYGWISMLGDITNDAESTYNPIFFFSPDSGNHWYGPTQVKLGDLPGVNAELGDSIFDGSAAASGIATTAFDADLAVDAYGNCHLITVVGNGSDYSIEAATYDVYDITSYPGTANLGCEFAAIHLADINTLRGDFTSNATPYTDDNRPLISTSPDGTKVFLFWNESDFNVTQDASNGIPNMFGRALDLSTNNITALKNFTEGDSLWGGETLANPGGVHAGATYPTVSTVAKDNGTSWNIPVTMTEIDYQFGQPLGDGELPARFFYITNIDYPNADFNTAFTVSPTNNYSSVYISLNGPDTIVLLQGTPFLDPGATGFGCGNGNLPVTVDTGNLNVNAVGTYTITYTTTDGTNTATTTMTVIIGNVPVADFGWNVLIPDYRFQFLDQSSNSPSAWAWTFGDGGISSQQNPIKQYTASANVQVCLTASNQFGSSAQVCKPLAVVIGINDPTFASTIDVYPNPSNGQVNIALEAGNYTELGVTVYNMLGEVVKEKQQFNVSGKQHFTINMNGVAKGLYLIRIDSNDATAVKPITIE